MEGTDWYYEAQFWSEMPDLNLDCEALREEIAEVTKYWLDMGVGGAAIATVISQAASAVRGHEMEHVYREQAKADREGRKVVSQNVTMHTEICPECGKAYVSGGTTRTVTAAKSDSQADQQPSGQSRAPFLP